MLQFEELRLRLESSLPKIEALSEAIGLKAMQKELEELEMRSAEPGFWDDMEKAQSITQRAASLKDNIERYDRLVAT